MFSCFSYLEQPGYNLLRAVETGDYGMVAWLLSSGVSPDVRNSNDIFNRTSLHEAAINNSTEVAQLLITHKADIEARDKDNRTPIQRYNSTEVAQLLITHKADIKQGMNTMKRLFTRLHLTTAQLLITHKADIAARNEYNETPIHQAFNNSTEVAQLLITHKEADIEARVEFNQTPLHLAAIHNSTEVGQ